MAAQKPLQLDTNGNITEVSALQTSAGSGSAGAIVALNSSGLIDTTMLPSSGSVSMTASESISAGALINVWNNSGTMNVRNADNTSIGKQAHGYAPSAISSSASGTIILGDGENTSVSGLTAGTQYLLSTVGAVTATLPTGTGVIVQPVGIARSTTELSVLLERPVIRA